MGARSEGASLDEKLFKSAKHCRFGLSFERSALGIARIEQLGKHVFHEFGAAGIASHATAEELFPERSAQPLFLSEEKHCEQ